MAYLFIKLKPRWANCGLDEENLGRVAIEKFVKAQNIDPSLNEYLETYINTDLMPVSVAPTETEIPSF